MANPTAPTATTIVTEAYYKVGMANPSGAQITRAETYFLEEVKDDIWRRPPAGSHLKTLQNQAVQITEIGISKYSFETDHDQVMSISFLDGTHTGTAQAGANTTITLAASEDATAEEVEGNYILITGATAKEELRQVTDYNITTKVATVSTAWGTNPDVTSTYRVVDAVTEIDEVSLDTLGPLGNSFALGDPTYYSKVTEADSEYFLFDAPPDASTYGILIRYYSNIHLLDLTSNQVARVYLNWRDCLVYGVAAKIAEDEDDTKYDKFKAEYEARVADLLIKELPEPPTLPIVTTVSDQTAATLVAEAFYKAGIASPTPTQITRAKEYLLPEIKHDIWTRKDRAGKPIEYKILQNVSVDITTVGIGRMALPTDFDHAMSISLLTGAHTGTASAGASTTITLESGEDASEVAVVGNYILATGGTGENELRQATTYSTSTLVATVSPAWGTNPSSDTTYRIIDQELELEEESIQEIGIIGNSWATGKPSSFAYMNEGVNRYIIFNRPPDASTYGIIFRYYSNINEVATTEGSTIITNIYRDWRTALVYGVAKKMVENKEDPRYEIFMVEYEKEVADIVAKELPYNNQFEGFTL